MRSFCVCVRVSDVHRARVDSRGLVFTLGSDCAPKNDRTAFIAVYRMLTDSGILIGPLATGIITELGSVKTASYTTTGVAAVAVLWMLVCVKETLRKGGDPKLDSASDASSGGPSTKQPPSASNDDAAAVAITVPGTDVVAADGDGDPSAIGSGDDSSLGCADDDVPVAQLAVVTAESDRDVIHDAAGSHTSYDDSAPLPVADIATSHGCSDSPPAVQQVGAANHAETAGSSGEAGQPEP